MESKKCFDWKKQWNITKLVEYYWRNSLRELYSFICIYISKDERSKVSSINSQLKGEKTNPKKVEGSSKYRSRNK